SARALTLGRRGPGASEARRARSARALDGPQLIFDRRPSARALTLGRRGPGASEARRARSARALDGPPGQLDPPEEVEQSLAASAVGGKSGLRRAGWPLTAAPSDRGKVPQKENGLAPPGAGQR